MASGSFFKELVRSFFFSLFRVVAIGIGIVIVFAALSVILKQPPAARHTTTATVIPNHEWKQNPLSSTTPTIVKIPINGVIGLDHLTQANIRTQLIDTIDGEIKRDQVKGVLLTINTPGGTVDDSDGIYRLLLEYKKRLNVPVYAYVDGFCASGGMYIACAADKIFATDSSLIGHVGVMLPTIFNFSNLMDHLGIQSKTITAGKDKDALNPFRPWKENEAVSFQHITDVFYAQFIDIVTKSRTKITKEALIESGAQVYPPAQAEELGYIDARINTLDDAMKLLATDLNIEKEYQVVEFQTKSWLDELFTGDQALFPHKMASDHKITHEIKMPGMLPGTLHGKFLYLYHPEDHRGQSTSH